MKYFFLYLIPGGGVGRVGVVRWGFVVEGGEVVGGGEGGEGGGGWRGFQV